MSIINSRGIFNLGTAYLRQVGNDWPTAQVIFTSDITEGINLYYNNARVYSNVIALLPTLAGSGIQIQANGQINSNTTLTLDTLSPFLTTSNVSEGSNLYYTNARVLSYVSPLLTTSNVSEGSNLYYTNARVISAILPYLTTSNVAEGSNLYYTNARVLSALTGNVTIGNLTLTGSGPTLRSYVNSYKGNSQSATITLPIAPISSNFVTVIINGVAQLSSAYTVSGNVLTFTSYPTTNADIDVRILDVTQPIVGEATAQEQLHPFLLSLL